jgi:hypothetical protein
MMYLPVSNRLLPIAYGLGALLIVVLALAWFDGGREDLHEIVMPLEPAPVTIPEPVS